MVVRMHQRYCCIICSACLECCNFNSTKKETRIKNKNQQNKERAEGLLVYRCMDQESFAIALSLSSVHMMETPIFGVPNISNINIIHTYIRPSSYIFSPPPSLHYCMPLLSLFLNLSPPLPSPLLPFPPFAITS